MIDEVRDIQEHQQSLLSNNTIHNNYPGLTERPLVHENTLTNQNPEETIIPEHPPPQTLINTRNHRSDNEGTDTFQSSSCNTMIELSSESSDTMIINENGTETENDADSQQDTLKVKSEDIISEDISMIRSQINHCRQILNLHISMPIPHRNDQQPIKVKKYL